MAHEIDMTTGKAAVFVKGEPAWHKLGTVVRDAQTSEEAIKLARLNWTVEQAPLTAEIDGTLLPVPGWQANVRSDTGAVLGVVGDGYTPFQNSQAFDFMDHIVGERLAMFESAGSLKGGRHVWMMARLPGGIRVAGDDVVKPYILLANGHDGSRALRIIPTSVRVVCWNTLTLATGRAAASEGMTIRHHESLAARVSEARNKLGIINARFQLFAQQSQAIARRRMSEAELTTYFTGLVKERSEKQQEKLLGKFLDNLHNERNSMTEIRGSVWAAYNAVSEFADHEMTVHGQGAAKLDNRVNSMWFGSGNSLKQQAWEAAMALAV